MKERDINPSVITQTEIQKVREIAKILANLENLNELDMQILQAFQDKGYNESVYVKYDSEEDVYSNTDHEDGV